MARVQVIKSDTFENWRQKSNQVNATVGDNDTLVAYSQQIFTGLIGENVSTFTGSAAVFSVTKDRDGYSLFITNTGSGYEAGYTINIPGSQMGGIDGIHDATITVDTVNLDTQITTASITGTPNYELVAEVNQLRSDVGNTVDDPLTTTAQTLHGAVNELDAFQGNETLTTTSQIISGAINELDAKQGGANLVTTAQNISSAINELDDHIGGVENLLTNATDLVAAINEIKATADDAQSEIGGDMATDFDGDDTNIISALNNLFNASSVSTLNGLYLRRDGVGAMQGAIDVDQYGLKSSDNAFIIATGSTDTTRLTINTSGNVGVGRAPSSYKMDVQGSLNATTLRYQGEDTDTRYLRAGGGSGVTNITVPVDFQNATQITGDFTIGTELVFDADGYTFSEWSQDLVGAMFTGNQVSGGITSTYNDTTGKVTLAIADDGHNHVVGNIDDFDNQVKDRAAAMITGGSHSGLTVSYDNALNQMSFNVNDPTLTFTGGATGSATMTNLGNTSIALTLDRDSVQDLVGQMLQGNTETGITVTYDDANNEIDFELSADPTLKLVGDVTGQVTLTNLATQTFELTATVGDNSHNHTFSNISDGTTSVQGIVRSMVDPVNIESGISVTYSQDGTKLNFDVNDPTITLSGDVTGSATMTNLGSINIVTTTVNNSHTHLASNITDFAETVEDVMAGRLVGGTGITITHDDSGNTITVTRDAIQTSDIANDAIDQTKLKNVVSLVIRDSAGTALKTIYGAGS